VRRTVGCCGELCRQATAWTYFLLPRVVPCRWPRALPAADLDDRDVRPSRRTRDALLAAALPVVFLVRDWARALPAADFEARPVVLLLRVVEALDAALCPVLFEGAMISSYRLLSSVSLPDVTNWEGCSVGTTRI
jgi:hypothetical protein